MHLIDLIARHAVERPQALAQRVSTGECITYGELWAASSALAAHLAQADLAPHAPVMVYGHKSPLMLASFLACMRSGHPYVPVDCHSVPRERVAAIAAQLDQPLVLAAEALDADGSVQNILDRCAIEGIIAAAGSSDGEGLGSEADLPSLTAIDGEDLCYILFTSGSTGMPKGVEVTAACVDNFCAWDLTLGGIDKAGLVYLDQAPFSFDLSVFELAGALAAGGTLFSLAHETQRSAAEQLRALGESGIDVWVSTPSFAELCLADERFSADLLPALKLFLFCGETLPNATAARLLDRFPGATVLNTYGPTESTVAVTEVSVTRAMAAAAEPLPVGAPRPGTRLRIVGEQGAPCGPNQVGEVVIEGDTVARGYFGRPDLTSAAFGVAEHGGALVRTYRTGDAGYLDEAGMLHYKGRLDSQVKLNGYRIELGEIEECLRRLPGVDAAALTTHERDGRVSHLVAHVAFSGGRGEGESDFRLGLRLKEQLKAALPHYMIPKKVVFHDALPMTGNGKIDRRALANSSAR